MKLFAGTAHPVLVKKVAEKMNITLSNVDVLRFGNSEVRVRIKEEVRGETCVVIQPTSYPTDTHLMELFLFCDALKREEASRIIAVIPYFGYAKQNIQHVKGDCVSANVVVRFLEAIGFHKVYTFDIHDEGTGGVFSIPFKNLTAFSLLAQYIRDYLKKQKINTSDVALVSPDQGAVEKVRDFGTVFYGRSDFSEAVIEKRRDQTVPHKAEPIDLYGHVDGKIALIVDDMVVSGSTLLPAVDLCLKKGAREVYATAVHHDFTEGACQKIQSSQLKRFFTTDTIALSKDEQCDKLVEISVASLIAHELKYL